MVVLHPMLQPAQYDNRSHMRLRDFAFGILQSVAVLPFLMIAALAAGSALAPAIYFFDNAAAWAHTLANYYYYPALGFIFVLCYFIYGFSLILIAPLFNLILGGRLKPWRGSAVSLRCLPWYIHACLTLVVRLSFLEFVTPTPFTILFYRLMGMKIGRNVTINSTAIADPSLIELGDFVTIGGSASIMAHYAQGGYLVINTVKIGKGATIGLRAIVMGGVTIGEKAKVLAGSFVVPNTVIPDGETWGGIPAVKLDLKKDKAEQAQ